METAIALTSICVYPDHIRRYIKADGRGDVALEPQTFNPTTSIGFAQVNRLTEQNQRLREDLERTRVLVREASAR